MLKPGNLEVSNKIREVSIEKQIIPLISMLLASNKTLKVLRLFVVRNKIKYCINIVAINISLFLSLAGKKELPDSKLIVEKFLLRKKFIPDPQGTNMMFTFFAQHFTHQFFKTDHKKGPGFTKAFGHGVRLSL